VARAVRRAVIERFRVPVLPELRLLLSTSPATSRRYDPGFSWRSWRSACLPCRRQIENRSVVKASLRQSRGGRPGPPAWPLTKRPRTSRNAIDRSNDAIASVPSLCAAAESDETCRLTRARAAIASARSIFTMASTDRDRHLFGWRKLADPSDPIFTRFSSAFKFLGESSVENWSLMEVQGDGW
jgi:hypothetical protein